MGRTKLDLAMEGLVRKLTQPFTPAPPAQPKLVPPVGCDVSHVQEPSTAWEESLKSQMRTFKAPNGQTVNVLSPSARQIVQKSRKIIAVRVGDKMVPVTLTVPIEGEENGKRVA